MSETKEHIDKVYDLLIDAGANPNDDARWRFIHSYASWLNSAEDRRFGLFEYRFEGKLGFGGKLKRDHNHMYVTCYPEDSTPERREIIAKGNEALAKL